MDFFKQYPSGLRVVGKKMENYTVSLGVFVNVGSVREDETTNGLSHFIEHLLFKGTTNRTSLQISEEMDDIGANMNAFTSKDTTCFYTKSSAEDLEKCIDVLSDMYFNATIPQKELDVERGVVLEEIKMCADTPDDVSMDLIAEASFGNQPLGRTILGNDDIIRYCDRHNILKFKEKHYIPSQTVISVCGKFDFEQIDNLVQTYFENNYKESVDVGDEPISKFDPKFLKKFKDIEQAHLEMSWSGCSFDSPDKYAISMLTSILCGGMTSRLYQTIREKYGLAYSLYSYASCYSNCGTIEIYAGISPDNAQKVCDLIEQELVTLLKDGVTQKEVDRAKVQAVNALYMNVESNLTLMRLCGKYMLKANKVYDVDEEIAKYKSVTVEQVNQVARKYLTNFYASSYVGPECEQYDAVSKIKI